jgi:3-hydroxyisobutyrate dehydrogenase-like beta-hydroxyacid dehydrogenase
MGAYGFIGLGNIGGPMATHLVDWPDGLVVYDVRPEATAPFAERGATVAADVVELARRSSVISIMVLNDAQVREVCAEIFMHSERGSAVAIHSTIHAETAAELAAKGSEYGIEVVDAPVSGGFMGAHAATLAVMVGGSDEGFARVAEPFAKFATMVRHMGAIGAGTRTKLARNLMHFTAFTAAGEAMRLADAAGLSLKDLGDVVRHSDAVTGGPGAIIVRDTTGPIAPDDGLYESFSHARDLGEKDLILALEMAADLEVDLPLAKLALNRLGTELGM